MTMYELSPIVTLPPIPRSRTMYEMRNIHEDQRHDSNTDAKMPDDVITEQEPSPEYSALEMRQEKILNQLAELKKQVSTLCYVLKQSNKIVKTEKVDKKGVNINVLIKVHPGRAPVSLLLLQNLWTDTDFRIKSYRHSTVKGEIPNIDCFSPQITCPTTSTTKNIINITLIWKNVTMMETFMDLQREPLFGEINFLRYLYRMVQKDMYEDDSRQMYRIDNALDLCYLSTCRLCKVDIYDTLLETIDEWSGKDKINIADIAVWCTVKQYKRLSMNEQKIKMWCHNIDTKLMAETNTLRKATFRLFMKKYYFDTIPRYDDKHLFIK